MVCSAGQYVHVLAHTASAEVVTHDCSMLSQRDQSSFAFVHLTDIQEVC
jgi:hypothetical protein